MEVDVTLPIQRGPMAVLVWCTVLYYLCDHSLSCSLFLTEAILAKTRDAMLPSPYKAFQFSTGNKLYQPEKIISTINKVRSLIV